MALDYSKFLTVATDLVTEFGSSVVLRETGVQVDPRTGTSSTSVTNTTVTAVSTPVTYEQVSRGLGKAGDRIMFLAGSVTLDPDKQNVIIMDSETWNIVSFEIVKPAATTILTKLHIRRAAS